MRDANRGRENNSPYPFILRMRRWGERRVARRGVIPCPEWALIRGNTMKKKGTLLGSVLAVTVSSAPALAAEFDTSAGLQGTTPFPLQNTALGAKEFGAECESVDNSTAATWNAGEFCLATDHNTSTTGSADPAVVNDAAVAASPLPRVPLRDGTSLSESRRSPSASAPMGPECVSFGGSTAATGDDGGFCLASNLSTSTTGIAKFAFANGLPAAGLQFLQITSRDGSAFVGSRPIPSTGAPTGPKCVSAGGSTAATGDDGGFCLASNLSTSTTGIAKFAFANGLPAAGLQFLQITFADGGSPGGSRHSPGTGAQCVSVDGSTAATGDGGRFCLVSDLNTSSTGFANLSVANDLPVAGMQYLQVTFRDGSPLDGSGHSPGAGAPMGAECVSVDGSTATTAEAGESCLASDLSTLTAGAANFAVANDLLVAGLQYLQVTFRDGSPLGGSGHSPGVGAECVSVGGSTAATGNAGGFCLVSDRNASKTGFANFAVANDLPVAALQFVRVPFRADGSLDGSRRIPRADAPMGVVISDPDRFPIQRLSPPALAGIADHPQRYFHIGERRSGMVMNLSPNGRRHPSPVFWLSRPLTCNGLPATIAGTFGNDTLVGTPGNDVMHGRGGNDVIHGLQGNDIICGGGGNDQLFGDQGRDRLFGGAGNDGLKGGMASDRLFGQEGNDAMDGQRGNDDNCNGGIGADTARTCEQPRKVP